jgi:ribonuclease J
VHVTGHPRRDELRQMYSWLQPQALIPMHGEGRHLRAHAKLAAQSGIKNVVVPEDGAVVRLAPGKPAIIDEAPIGRRYRDGKLILTGDDGPIRERRRLSTAGIVIVSVALTRRGEVVSDHLLTLDGVPTETKDEELMRDVVLDTIDGTIESIPPARRKNPELVREAIRRAVRATFNEEWGKKPIVKVLLHVIE